MGRERRLQGIRSVQCILTHSAELRRQTGRQPGSSDLAVSARSLNPRGTNVAAGVHCARNNPIGDTIAVCLVDRPLTGFALETLHKCEPHNR